jgi:hypothetical protein
MPTTAPFGDANPGNDNRNAGAPSGNTANDVRVKQKRLHNLRRSLSEISRELADDWKVEGRVRAKAGQGNAVPFEH